MSVVSIDEIPGGYCGVLDTIFCGILVLNGEEQLIYCNSAAQALFQKLSIDVDKALLGQFDEFILSLSKSVNLISGKGRYIIDIDGIKVVCNVHPWMVDSMRQGTVILLHESTHAHCLMQELEVTSNLLQELDIFVESSHDGFLVTDSCGVVSRVNTAFERVFSISRRNVLGRNVSELVAEGLYQDSAALKVIETLEPATVMIERRDKRLIATGTPAFDAYGTFTSVVVNLRDISELNDLQNKLEHQRMVAQGYIQELSFFQSQNTSGDVLVAHSKAMRHISDTIRSISRVDSTLLITGEPGTGKEVVVNQVHHSSNRAGQPFIRINCAAIPASLFDAELYGYEDGAFPPPRQKGRAGFFEMAHKGTLFLDEIGELDLELQIHLLRVIQEEAVTRIGGTRTHHADVRIIAAASQDLWELVREGKFRQDLYYRLNVINIEVPPLRERRDDILPLALHFVQKYNARYNKRKELSMELGKTLCKLDWPGNIQELENLIETMVVLARSDVLGTNDLPHRYQQLDAAKISPVSVHDIVSLKEAVREVERQLLLYAQGKYSTTREMAKALGVDQSTISRKLSTYAIQK